jgi:Fur family transcriptional regulator, ferric uptake regulator
MTTAAPAPASRPVPARPGRAGERPQASFRARAREALLGDGYRMTKQRDTLLDVVERAEGHLDADGIYDLARRRDPRISLSTVYRTLNLLKRHDLVDAPRLSRSHHHYELKSAGPQHFHLVCVDCGGVQDVGGGLLDGLRDGLQLERGFRPTEIHLDVQGHCGRCAPAL